jgi:ribosomal-protein-alanine N-acetyltransferase
LSFDACFKKLPGMETSRLNLRQITDSVSDGLDCLEFVNNYNVYRYWGLYDEENDPDGRHKPKKKTSPSYQYNITMKEYKAGRELSWLMELKDSHKVIGEIVLYDFRLKNQADIGYRINQDYWGQGFATEAVRAVIKAGFEQLELSRLQIRCFTKNIGSMRVAEKLGFTKEGLIRQSAILNVITDYYVFGLLRDEYEHQPIMDSVVRIENIQV